jgi:hypothetical protein
MSQADGVGTSKSQAKEESTKQGQNGQDLSTKAHSISTKEALRSTTTQLMNHIKENNTGRVLSNVNNDTIKDYINHKIERGNSLSSINSEISLLGKIADNLNELGINTVSREAITDYRHELKEQGHNLQSENIDRTNSNPTAIVQAMNSDSCHGLSASLQYEAGLRAGDAINSEKWTLNNDNSLTVEGSKNGLTYTTNQLSQETADRVTQAIENGYQVSYNEYREELKEATEGTGQEFKGTHSLRYDSINERHEQNKAEGKTDEESKAELSIQNGHSRSEITEHYLKG